MSFVCMFHRDVSLPGHFHRNILAHAVMELVVVWYSICRSTIPRVLKAGDV